MISPSCPLLIQPRLAALAFSSLLAVSAFAAPAVYVDQAGDFTPVNPEAGTAVTWKPGTPDAVTGLTFGTDAFTSVQAAVDNVSAGGSVFIAAGTYLEGAEIAIAKSLTLQGDGAALTRLSGNSNGDTTSDPGEHRVIAITGSTSVIVINHLAVINGIAVDGRGGDGGGIIIAPAASLTLNHCEVSGNHANQFGGAIFHGIGGELTLNHTTFSGNSSGSNGGAVFLSGSGTLLTHRCVFSENTGGGGGAIFLEEEATGAINDSIFSGNLATRGGGAGGGAIWNLGGNFTVSGSTFVGNATPEDPSLDVWGGAIYTGSGTVLNCTFSGNSSIQVGGAILALGDLKISHSTITGNSARIGGGGISGGSVILDNTIVAGNTSVTNGPDIQSTFTSQGVNFIGDPTGATGFRAGTDLSFASTGTTLAQLLAPLADNGGPTPTHGLVLGSPAINAGDNDFIPAGLTTDQRGAGFVRIYQDTVDIGALEANFPISLVSTTPAAGSGGLAAGQNLTLTFNQDILAGSTGNILIRDDGGNILQTIALADTTIVGKTLSFLLAADLPEGTRITLEIADGTIVNAFGNTFGISDSSLTFTTCFAIVHVAAAGGFSPATPGAGDTVTWKTGTSEEVSGLIFGINAFHSVQAAVDNVCAGGSVFIAAGTYLEGAEIAIAKSLTLQGDGAALTRLSGNSSHRVIHITSATATVTLADLAVIDGRVVGGGGGILNSGTLSVNESTISGNSASKGTDGGGGGGIYNSGTLSVTSSKISGNSATSGGGIVNSGTLSVNDSTVSGNSGDGGGAISTGAGITTLTNSTLSENTASFGGGIQISGNSTTVLAINSTFSGNTATQGGGGIDNSEGSLSLVHCKITGNTAPAGKGSGVSSRGAAPVSTSVTASIIAGNINSDVDLLFGSVNTFTSGSHNLIGTGAAAALAGFTQTGDQTGVTDPGLAPLSDNGGPTLTHSLLPGSPAIDAGDNALIPAGLTTDQRGFPRVIGTSVDIGALEAIPALETVATTANFSPDLTTKISIADLLASLTGGGGLPLSLVSVGDPANTGSSVHISDGFIIYSPAPGQSESDSFTYQITDGFQTVTGTIDILPNEVANPVTVNILRLEIDGDFPMIVAAGIPGLFYHVQSSENLTDWEPMGQGMVCPADGIMKFPDFGSLPASRFYRVVDENQ